MASDPTGATPTWTDTNSANDDYGVYLNKMFYN